MAGLVGSLAMLLEHGRFGVPSTSTAYRARPAYHSSVGWTAFRASASSCASHRGGRTHASGPFQQRGLKAAVVGEIDTGGQVALRRGRDRVTAIDLSTTAVTGLRRA